MQALFLKPPPEQAGQNIVRDFIYGCWCNGRRIGGMEMPPLNELYSATHARQEGIDVELLDAAAEPNRYQALIDNKFDQTLAVAIMSSTQSFKHDRRVFASIKALNPKVHTILYGSHPTFRPKDCLEDEAIDFVVLREPEETIRELLGGLLRKEEVCDMPGLGLINGTGKPRVNPNRPFVKMDDLPIPDRTMLPKGVDYFNPVVKRVPYTTMQTSRGCPAHCIYCTAPFFYGNNHRVRSADQVLEEMRMLRGLGYREIFFRDETFTAYKKRNIEICQRMIDERLDLTWIANGRVDMIDLDTMWLMKKAGCHLLKFGVETGDEGILKAYKKGATAKQAEAVFQMAREVGIDTHAHMVFGGPGETKETINATMAFVRRISPTTATFGILTPYPGTPLFDMVAEKHPEIRDGSDSTMANLHTTGFFSEAICSMSGKELSKAIVRAYRKFYLRPSYLLSRLKSIQSVEEMMILAVAGTNVVQFALTGKK